MRGCFPLTLLQSGSYFKPRVKSSVQTGRRDESGRALSQLEHEKNHDVDRLAWCRALEDVGLLYHSAKIANCNKDILFIETCSFDGSHYKKPIYEHCSDRAYCPDCAAATAKKNALITYTWILENIAKNLPFNLYALRFDLTFPHEFDETSEEKIRAMVSRFMLELRGNDEGYDPDEEVAYLYVIHRFGSNDNIFNRHLNVHIYALNAVIVKGKFKRTRPWSNEERAKGIWGFILQEELGWTEFVEKNPDLRVQYIPFFKVNDKQGRPLEKPYATMAGKHLLTLRYMYRYPVIDVYKSFVKNGERGYRGGAERPPFMFNTSAVQSSDVREVLESHHRLTWCGYLSSKRKTEVVSLLMEKPIPLSQIIDKLPHKLCPKCNSPLIQEKFRDWRMTEGHSEEEDAAAYLQENDWGELERDRTGIKESTDLEESTLQQWKTSDAWEKELSHKARLARLNGW